MSILQNWPASEWTIQIHILSRSIQWAGRPVFIFILIIFRGLYGLV